MFFSTVAKRAGCRRMKVMSVIGTRPEAIKMAPVIKAIVSHPKLTGFVCLTAQHRRMLDQVLDLFEIQADADLDLMRQNQGLNSLSARIFEQFDNLLSVVKPDIVLTQGDTTTAFAASIACFHRKIDVGHIEAGLRTYDLERPFPEEMNRRVIDLVAKYLFAPTEQAKDNLLEERLVSPRIFVTGNTVVDALQFVMSKINGNTQLQLELQSQYKFLSPRRPYVLVTGHRRESFGDGFERICDALLQIAERADVEIVYPVHLNPNVTEPVNRILNRHKRIHLIAPTDYVKFVYLLSNAAVILTDSGGVQEESVSIGKRVLVMRERTERPEGIRSGLAELVGTDVAQITERCLFHLTNPNHQKNRRVRNIYGDGKAAARIVDVLTTGGSNAMRECEHASL
jgi:UDP-N-acetylglucosamine 2-epimerase (non-hydrolysing)